MNPITKRAISFSPRNYSPSSLLSSPLDQFRDSETREKRFSELVGRSWSVNELRRKSFDDLHKLWYVLYKEKNMLLTEANIHRRGQMYLPQPDRLQKVKKSMGAIKAVLGERKRDAIAQTALKQAMMEEQWKGSESGELEK
jgi:large subunit ribosomal protein L47